jgi:hypothetical protein
VGRQAPTTAVRGCTGTYVYVLSATIDRSFITTTQDPTTGRYTVTVDLRDYSGGGLITKGDGVWDSEADLRQWVADMTGVPLSAGDSLFDFDYVQLGTSTGVTRFSAPSAQFDNFFLDAITAPDGTITVGSHTTDLAALYDDDRLAPDPYRVERHPACFSRPVRRGAGRAMTSTSTCLIFSASLWMSPGICRTSTFGNAGLERCTSSETMPCDRGLTSSISSWGRAVGPSP